MKKIMKYLLTFVITATFLFMVIPQKKVVADRASAKSFEAGENLTVTFKNKKQAKDLVAISFDIKMNSSTGKAAIMVGNWTNYMGYYDVSSTGCSATGVKTVELLDGYMRVYIYPSKVTKINGSSGGPGIDTELQFVYVRGGWTTEGGKIDNLQMYTEEPAHLNATKFTGDGKNFAKYPLTNMNNPKLGLYLEFTMLEGKANFTLYDDANGWKNVTGKIEVTRDPDSISTNKGRVVKVGDDWFGLYLPYSTFGGDGKQAASNLSLIHGEKTEITAQIMFDFTTVKEVEHLTPTEYVGDPRTYFKDDKLAKSEFVNRAICFDFTMTDGKTKFALLDGDHGWANYTDYISITKTGNNISSTNGIVIKLNDGWYRFILNYKDFKGNADTAKPENDGISMCYCGEKAAITAEHVYMDWTTLRAIDEVDYGFVMAEGASIRLNEPNGLRFVAKIDAKSYDEDANYGMIIIPKDWAEYLKLDTGSNFVQVLNELNVNYVHLGCIAYKEDGNYFIQGSIVNIKETNMNREFVGIAYKEKAGVYTYAINSGNTLYARSYVSVAKKLKENTAKFDALTDQTKEYINNIITTYGK